MRRILVVLAMLASWLAGTVPASADNPLIGVGGQTVILTDWPTEKDAIVNVEFRAGTPAADYVLVADWTKIVHRRVRVRDWFSYGGWSWEWRDITRHRFSARRLHHRGGLVTYVIPLRRPGANFTVTATLAPRLDSANATSQTFQTGNIFTTVGVNFYVNPAPVTPPPPVGVGAIRFANGDGNITGYANYTLIGSGVDAPAASIGAPNSFGATVQVTSGLYDIVFTFTNGVVNRDYSTGHSPGPVQVSAGQTVTVTANQ